MVVGTQAWHVWFSCVCSAEHLQSQASRKNVTYPGVGAGSGQGAAPWRARLQLLNVQNSDCVIPSGVRFS